MASEYKFTLSLYNKTNSINPVSGMRLSELSEIIKAVSKAVELEDIKCTLHDVVNRSQSLVFITSDKRGHDNYIDLWDRIKKSNGRITTLSDTQKDFGEVVTKYTKQGIYLKGLDTKDKEIAKIEKYFKESLPRYYFEVDEISGRIIEIGGRNEDRPHIIVNDTYDNQRTIRINEKQDLELYKYYKKNRNISFIVEFKYDFSNGKIISAKLKNYYTPGGYDYYSAVKKVKEDYPNIFENLQDPVQSIIESRKAENE